MSGDAGAGRTRREHRSDKRSSCWAVAAEAISRWRAGEPPDARGLLEEHPELRRHKSLVLDLAYEEYCLRGAGGESVAPAEFCTRFPTYQKSLERRLEIHRLLQEESSFRRELGEAEWPRPGREMMGFEILEELGRGTFGRVYLAREKELGDRLVAVKFCLSGADEADTLGKLEHPNIVPVHSVRRDSTGLTVICMPFRGRATLCDVLDMMGGPGRRPERAGAILEAVGRVDADKLPAGGGDSAGSLVRGSLTTGVVWIAWRLADALAHAHSRGVVHLDLKPSNVLVDRNGAPLLLDFNLSSDRNRAGRRFGGTLPYMSPEQIRAVVLEEGSGEAIDGRSDIFSLGVMLYELAYGQLPFGAALRARTTVEAAKELLKRQQEGVYFPEDRRVGGGIARVIRRCLTLDSGGRFPTAAELAAALERELSMRRRLMRWASRRRALAATAGLLTLAALAAIVLFAALRPPYSEREYDRALAAFQRKDDSAAIQHLDRSLDADPSLQKARLLRAQAFARQHDNISAIRDLRILVDQTSNPKIMAFLGYCLNESKYHVDAVAYYLKSIDGGLESVETYNNLGYSYLQLGQFAKAENALNKALELGPRVPAVLHNFARTEFIRAQQQRSAPFDALARLDRALAVGNWPSQLYRDGALLTALAARTHPEAEPQCVAYLTKAINAGDSIESLLAVPYFTPYFEKYPTLRHQRRESTDAGPKSFRALLPLSTLDGDSGGGNSNR